MANEQSPTFVCAGIGDNWDIKGTPHIFALRSDSDNRHLYSCTFKPVLPTERFQIVEKDSGWSIRYYPMGGPTHAAQSSCIRGDGDHGDGINWFVPWASIRDARENRESGHDLAVTAMSEPQDEEDGENETETKTDAGTVHGAGGSRNSERDAITVYFNPETRQVEWEAAEFDPVYQLSAKLEGEILANDIWSSTQLSIVSRDDVVSKIFLMASNRASMLCISLFHILPILIMGLLLDWVAKSTYSELAVTLYKPNFFVEWLIVALVFLSLIAPELFDFFASLKQLQSIWRLAGKIQENAYLRIGLRLAVVVSLLDFIQPFLAIALSAYVAAYLHEGVFLNVIINIVVLEFIHNIDEKLVDSYIRGAIGVDRRSVSVAITDISYTVHESNDFWGTSDSSKEYVLTALAKGDVSNTEKLRMMADTKFGLGLAGAEVRSLRMTVNLVDWQNLEDDEIQKYGAAYLNATTDYTWSHMITKNRRALFFHHFPEIARNFAWRGTVHFKKMEARHVPHLCHIIANQPDCVEIWLHAGDYGNPNNMAELCAELSRNSTVEKVGFPHCNLNNQSCSIVADMLKTNTGLKYLWLMQNRDIGDDSLPDLIAALEQNVTLYHLYLHDTGVTEQAKEEASDKTSARMKF
eukprot:CAMPEP_0202718890 /NCGR_PEP_ID=MMETSP1385-20130828/126469_1 /ASSEMBLY_ACC=CAM_ASM_000861 /TAXON_ID=933848 /ORGANISM="Elphidium margaritaceum" /LENGTH=636 /DNA_ID=CAMNT_0049381815 /DNA_START=36 /DNA_END=1946 /DNA_ORIENTATION=+